MPSRSVPFETTLAVRDRCLCFQAQRAGRALARRFDQALAPVDLTNGQFSLLMSLNRPEPPNLGAVAETLAMDRTTVTAALKPLERRGLVTCDVDRADRRHRRLRLTEAGFALLAAAVPLWEREHARLDEAIGDEVEALRLALQALGRVGSAKLERAA